MTHYKRLSSFALVAIALLMVAVAASIGLMGHIDAKLKQSAEQQVITFTRQAAGNVADRVYAIQNALSVFTVQSADPEDVVPALAALQELSLIHILPVHDDDRLFEMLVLECFQAGLSWECILNKREAFRRAFDGFDLDAVCAYGQQKVEALLQDASIVRNLSLIHI